MQTNKFIWKETELDHNLCLAMEKDLKVSSVISKILVARGINDFDSAQDYFRPNKKQFHDGFLMKGIQKHADCCCESGFLINGTNSRIRLARRVVNSSS